MVNSSDRRPTLVLVILLVLCCVSHEFVSGASTNDKESSKFRSRRARTPDEIVFGVDATTLSKSSKCHHEINLIWRASLGAGVPSNPMIVDMRGDGDKEIVATTANHFIEVLEGHNGRKESGWPFAFASSGFSSSALLYDVDRDGSDDVVVATANGEIVFLNQSGLPAYGKTLKVPPLRVNKDWYEGIANSNNIAVSVSLRGLENTKPPRDGDDGKASGRHLLQTPSKQEASSAEKNVWVGFEGTLTPEGIESLDLFLPSDTPSNFADTIKDQVDPLFSEQFPDSLYDRRRDGNHIWIDAHILATPVIADIDGDSNDDLIVPVSYYFDKVKYDDPTERRKIGLDVDLTKYVAGGIVVFDLASLSVKWEIPFDITVENSAYSGFVTASPTVVDFDRNGQLEIIAPTGVGYVYLINSKGMIEVDNFPLLMDAIQSEIAVADLHGDGHLEMVVTDAKSNIAVFSSKGAELWEGRLSGYASAPPVFADVDGDGILDILIGTSAGHIWALRGDTGAVLPNYPIKIGGQIHSRLLLLPLSSDFNSLQIIASSTDGHMYVIDSKSGCVDKVDVGEPSYTSVLADDITGNGLTDLLVTTSAGSAYCFDTTAPYHPLRSWTAQNVGVGSFAAKTHQTIYVTPFTRNLAEVAGNEFPLEFEIVDKRPAKGIKPYYRVKALLGKTILFEKNYTSPGVYTETVSVPNKRLFAKVTVEMVNEFHQHFVDSFSINFNVYFYRTLKYILLLPFGVMSLALLFTKELRSAPLPLKL